LGVSSGVVRNSDYERDRGRSQPDIDVLAGLRLAHELKGKSYASQFAEILRLGLGDGQLSAKDYFYYRLYDDDLYSPDEKRRFLSENITYRVAKACCDIRCWGASEDKILAYTLLGAAGAPVPETQAVFSHAGRQFGGIPRLAGAADLAEFLAGEARFPLFCKPIGGFGSFGACLLTAREGDRIEAAGGERFTTESLARRLGEGGGCLLQSVLQQHSALRPVCEAVATVRIIVLVEQGRPEILHTLWKIPAAGNFADNFWRKGNLLADLEPETGTVRRVIRGFGPAIEELETHPETGRRLQGLSLPHWKAAVDLALGCAPIFAMLRYQSWDIAICPEGPVIVEVNTGSAFTLPQLATGRGMLSDRFAAFLAACGYPLKSRR
jgi:hypothetical protein